MTKSITFSGRLPLLVPHAIRRCSRTHICLQRRAYPFLTGTFPPDNSFPEYKKPTIDYPKDQFSHFCEICATGVGIIDCVKCDGKGFTLTKPGGAGVRGKVGQARCRTCNGVGLMPCPMCVGCKRILPPPRDPRLDFPIHPFDT